MSEFGKITTSEYLARRGIDVATAVITTVAVTAASYGTMVYGPTVINKTKKLASKVKTRFKK